MIVWIETLCQLINELNTLISTHLRLYQTKKDDVAEHRQLLEKCAATAMSSKLIHHHKEFFSKMVVDAVMQLDELLPLNMIGIKKVSGGGLTVSF